MSGGARDDALLPSLNAAMRIANASRDALCLMRGIMGSRFRGNDSFSLPLRASA
jgi:hypothetical protein